MKLPLVTIGMPVFNRAHLLKNTIEQVLNQTYTNYEFVIVNDGSSDNSAEVVNSFNDPRIIFYDLPKQGPPHPLNKILEVAKGEYIIILHDHDFFDRRLIEKSVTALLKYPEAGFVLQGSAWINEDGVSNYCEMLHNLPELNHGRGFGENILLNKKSFSSIFHACSMVRVTAYEKVGKYYNIDYGLYADTDLWLRLLYEYSFVYVNEVLFKFRNREKEKHFLDGKELEILEWNVKIHSQSSRKYFPDGTDRLQALIKRKARHQYFLIRLRDLLLSNEVYINTALMREYNLRFPFINRIFSFLNSSLISPALKYMATIYMKQKKKNIL